MFGPRSQRFFRMLAEWWVRPLAAAGITPNMLTVAGFAFACASAAAIATHHLITAAILLFVGGAFDLSDGALARVQESRSIFGAFFDSTLDRYSEAIVLLGFAYLYAQEHRTDLILVVFAGLIGSIMVSYTRARAEGLGFECKEGLYARPERVMTLVVGLLLYPWVLWFLIALAVLSNITAIQRILHIWRLTHPRSKASQAGAGTQSLPGSGVSPESHSFSNRLAAR
ncbi:MAG TPA: CDP-alcohol phosphatidyltransferase family protein [Chloroflexota bacterium]|nr:CDP-alcohol phosphatidyltransferase family protein [Chloroflexota bacterium]